VHTELAAGEWKEGHEQMTGKNGKEMDCAEFQKELPYMFESGGEIRHEHLSSCEDCNSLVQDLRYIADQAKLLLPMHDPSPRVWDNIQTSLTKDGLIGESRGPQAAQKKNNEQYIRLAWAAAAAAVLLAALILFQNSSSSSPTTQVADNSQAGFTDKDDQQLIAGLEKQAPALKPAYESSLRDVNQYISDARATLAQDPNDDDARVHLRKAYAQKAMLYRMGTARSFNESSSGQ
jgi:hypothetical protein